jgi:hypothetical protein
MRIEKGWHLQATIKNTQIIDPTYLIPNIQANPTCQMHGVLVGRACAPSTRIDFAISYFLIQFTDHLIPFR